MLPHNALWIPTSAFTQHALPLNWQGPRARHHFPNLTPSWPSAFPAISVENNYFLHVAFGPHIWHITLGCFAGIPASFIFPNSISLMEGPFQDDSTCFTHPTCAQHCVYTELMLNQSWMNAGVPQAIHYKAYCQWNPPAQLTHQQTSGENPFPSLIMVCSLL